MQTNSQMHMQRGSATAGGQDGVFVDLQDGVYNGMPATGLPGAQWRKSARSGPQGNCVEFAEIEVGGRVAVRNSRHPQGPALVYTRAEIHALILGAKDGDFDHLLE